MRLLAAALILVTTLEPTAQDSSIPPPTILSNTEGHDFGPYIGNLVRRVRSNWYSVMPEVAIKGQSGRAVILFTIVRDGRVEDVRVVVSAGHQALDRAAASAITLSSPFPALPEAFKGNQLRLQLSFLYNPKPDDR